MLTLFLLFLIQILGGFFVILSIEHLKNPEGSLLKCFFDWNKAYIIDLFHKISNLTSAQRNRKDLWLGIFIGAGGVLILLFLSSLFFRFPIEWEASSQNPESWKVTSTIIILGGGCLLFFAYQHYQKKEEEKNIR